MKVSEEKFLVLSGAFSSNMLITVLFTQPNQFDLLKFTNNSHYLHRLLLAISITAFIFHRIVRFQSYLYIYIYIRERER